MVANPYPYTARGPYLGVAGQLAAIPVPDFSSITATVDRAIVTHRLASGGTTTSKRRYPRRVFSYGWHARTVDELDVITSIFGGGRGPGPYCLLDPAWRNQLDFDVSNMGAAIDVASGWSTSATATMPQTSLVTAPFAGSDVGLWTSPVLNSFASASAQSGALYIPSITSRPYAPAYHPSEAWTFSVYARSASGTPSAAAAVMLVTPTGTATITLGATTALSSAAWTRLTVSIAANAGVQATTPYIHGAVKALTSSSPNIYLACPQLEMSSSVTPWINGGGVPRVVIASPMGNEAPVWTRRTSSLVLAEI